MLMKMKKCIALVLSLLILSACSSAPQGGAETAPEKGRLTVTDDLGRVVSVSKEPDRVAALIGSFADIWALAGGLDSLAAAADDTWTSFDLSLSEKVANLGSVKEISLEALIASRPDLILASCNTEADVALLDTFNDLGYTVLYFRVDSFDEYLHMLDICTKITGKAEYYQQNGEAVATQVERAVARQDGREPSVLYIRATGVSCTAKGSDGNVLGEMLRALGCRNIADQSGRRLENLNIEVIMEEDPEYIFIVYQGSDPSRARALLDETLLSNPAWATMSAVQEGRCFILDHRLYNLKPNGRWGVAYEQLADILYGTEISK